MADLEADLLAAQREAGLQSDWDDLPPPGAVRDKRSVAASPAAAVSQPSRWRAVWVAAGAALALAVLVVALLRGAREPRPAPAPAPPPPSAEAPPRAAATAAAAATPAEPRPPAPAPAPAPATAHAAAHTAPPAAAAERPRPRPAGDPALGRKLVSEGDRLLSRGRLDEARQRYQAALRSNSRSGRAYTGLAQVAFERSDYGRAVELARKAVALNRRHKKAYLLLGDAYFNLMRYGDARRAWQRVLELDPGNARTRQRLQKLEKKTR
jgi:tetratricopeptide (TPR) repeat protein